MRYQLEAKNIDAQIKKKQHEIKVLEKRLENVKEKIAKEAKKCK